MSSTNPWACLALAVRERESAVLHCEYLLRNESPLYDADTHRAALATYRTALLGVRRAVEELLAALPVPEEPPPPPPPPEPMPEKVAGFISPSVHG